MADRKAMDRPATAILAVSGLLFIGLSVPFIPTAYCNLAVHNPALCDDVAAPTPVTFDVTWTPSPTILSTAATVDGAPGTSQAQINVTGLQGNVVVEVTACDDEFQDPVQQPASVTYVLSTVAGTLHTETFACSAQPSRFVHEQPQPAIATVQNVTEEGARANVAAEAAAQSTSVTYTLTITTTREGPTAPVPLPTDPTLNVQASLAVSTWTYAINARSSGVPK